MLLQLYLNLRLCIFQDEEEKQSEDKEAEIKEYNLRDEAPKAPVKAPPASVEEPTAPVPAPVVEKAALPAKEDSATSNIPLSSVTKVINVIK